MNSIILLQILERELDRLEEERIELKTDNRRLARQLGQKAAELALEPEDLQVSDLSLQYGRLRQTTLTTLCTCTHHAGREGVHRRAKEAEAGEEIGVVRSDGGAAR